LRIALVSVKVTPLLISDYHTSRVEKKLEKGEINQKKKKKRFRKVIFLPIVNVADSSCSLSKAT
jgi:hypothetical protein